MQTEASVAARENDAAPIYTVAVHLKGDDLDPQRLSDVIGLAPTRSHRKGERWTSRSGSGGTRNTGLWSRAFEGKGFDVSADVVRLTSDAAVASLSALPGVEEAYFDVFFAVHANDDGGAEHAFALAPDALLAIGKAGLPIRFTVAVIAPGALPLFELIASLAAVNDIVRDTRRAIERTGLFAKTDVSLIPVTGRDWVSEQPTASLYFYIHGDLKNPAAGSPSFGAELTMRWSGSEWLLEHDIGWVRSGGWDPVVSTETAFASTVDIVRHLEAGAERFRAETLEFLSAHFGVGFR